MFFSTLFLIKINLCFSIEWNDFVLLFFPLVTEGFHKQDGNFGHKAGFFLKISLKWNSKGKALKKTFSECELSISFSVSFNLEVTIEEEF